VHKIPIIPAIVEEVALQLLNIISSLRVLTLYHYMAGSCEALTDRVGGLLGVLLCLVLAPSVNLKILPLSCRLITTNSRHALPSVEVRVDLGVACERLEVAVALAFVLGATAEVVAERLRLRSTWIVLQQLGSNCLLTCRLHPVLRNLSPYWSSRVVAGALRHGLLLQVGLEHSALQQIHGLGREARSHYSTIIRARVLLANAS